MLFQLGVNARPNGTFLVTLPNHNVWLERILGIPLEILELLPARERERLLCDMVLFAEFLADRLQQIPLKHVRDMRHVLARLPIRRDSI